jgi:four helix bundle protein
LGLDLAEGQGRSGRDRQHHWRIAYGSALETASALSLLQAAHCIDDDEASRAIELFDRVRAMTWRLIHPTR